MAEQSLLCTPFLIVLTNFHSSPVILNFRHKISSSENVSAVKCEDILENNNYKVGSQ